MKIMIWNKRRMEIYLKKSVVLHLLRSGKFYALIIFNF